MASTTEIAQEKIIFFDGVCNLCNVSVNFIIDWDKRNYFKLAALQSDLAGVLLPAHGIDPEKLESIVLYTPERVYRRSRAALEIARQLGGAWPLLYGFIIVPAVIRDVVYDWIARNRYRWFGKREACRMPTPEITAKFADS